MRPASVCPTRIESSSVAKASNYVIPQLWRVSLQTNAAYLGKRDDSKE